MPYWCGPLASSDEPAVGEVVDADALESLDPRAVDGKFVLTSEYAAQMKRNDNVQIRFNDVTIETKLLQISPVINPLNQTRHVRFALKKGEAFMPGMRSSATISLHKPALKVSKKAVVKASEGYILFVQEQNRFTTHKVNVLGESSKAYFIEPVSLKNSAIVTEGSAVLKGMLEKGDD